ncbi:uncharacterized protein C8R40DRAFT_1066772 [Lentinula edodes]|uniref:uncharacterized protein n=1 Tax=Lentinula edodes TaxID=5353 RepID=UPI001E8EE254|nr:uncharacterized protein C8R40DRAFT_1066772 [Lentinula edodes]KAH7879047.1 hypothetical protein C8R40DRAFT_1066772 [Lentinula edodes]
MYRHHFHLSRLMTPTEEERIYETMFCPRPTPDEVLDWVKEPAKLILTPGKDGPAKRDLDYTKPEKLYWGIASNITENIPFLDHLRTSYNNASYGHVSRMMLRKVCINIATTG